METKHTPEPWHLKPMDSSTNKYWTRIEIFAGDRGVMEGAMYNAFDQGELNARRIVACVNACEGIDIERLENGEGWIRVDVFESATKQRDELAAALREALFTIKALDEDYDMRTVYKNGMSALAKL